MAVADGKVEKGLIVEEHWIRVIENLVRRLDGPMHLRFMLQPVMAIIFAVIDGAKDAKAGKPPYLWTIVFRSGERGGLIKDGWKSVGKIFIIAVILDLVYQVMVHHWVYPGETLIVAFLLAIVPYILLRGPVNRIVKLFIMKKA